MSKFFDRLRVSAGSFHFLPRVLLALPLSPLLVSIATYLALAYVPQFHELYLAYIEGIYGGDLETIVQSAFAALMLATFSVTLYIATAELGRYRFDGQYGSKLTDPDLAWRVRWFGLLFSLGPIVGCAHGISLAIIDARLHVSSIYDAAVANFEPFRLDAVDLDTLLAVKQRLEALGGLLPSEPGNWFPLVALAGLLLGAWIRSGWEKIHPRLYERATREQRNIEPEAESADKQTQRSSLALAAGLAHGTFRTLELHYVPSFGRLIRQYARWLAIALTLGSLAVPIFLEYGFSGYAPPASTYAIEAWGRLVCALLIANLVLLQVPLQRRRARALLYWMRIVAFGLFAATVAWGFLQYKWVPVSRGFGPLATALAVMLVIFALLAAVCIASRAAAMPSFIGVVVTTLIIVLIKLEMTVWLLIVFVALVLLAWYLLSRAESKGGLIVAAAAAVTFIGLCLKAPSFPTLWQDGSATVAEAGKSEHTPPKSSRPEKLSESFAQWYDARYPEWQKVAKGRPLPVLIIAAEGGGIYAAAASATFLARMQDRCPSFSQHVFAISAVSGGGIGAVVFDRIAHGEKREPATTRPLSPEKCAPDAAPRLQSAVRSVIKQDHLSPVVGLLVPELIGLHEDRAQGLVKSLALDLHAADEDVSRRNYQGHWNPKEPPSALVLNATSVNNGDRVAFAPFDLTRQQNVTLTTFSHKPEWAEAIGSITLLNAAVVSARFPGVVSAYELKVPAHDKKPDQRWHFVDGGYVDSSGSLTAHDMYRYIDEENRKHPNTDKRRWDIDLRLVLLTSTQSDPSEGSESPGLKDLAAPFRAVLNVRGLLSRIAVRDTIAKVDAEALSPLDDLAHRSQLPAPPGTQPGGEPWRVSLIELNQRYLKLPLGWKLSGQTFDLISLQLGQAENCSSAKELAEPKRARISRASAVAPRPTDLTSLSAYERASMRVDERFAATRQIKEDLARTIRANSCLMASLESLLSPVR